MNARFFFEAGVLGSEFRVFFFEKILRFSHSQGVMLAGLCSSTVGTVIGSQFVREKIVRRAFFLTGGCEFCDQALLKWVCSVTTF